MGTRARQGGDIALGHGGPDHRTHRCLCGLRDHRALAVPWQKFAAFSNKEILALQIAGSLVGFGITRHT